MIKVVAREVLSGRARGDEDDEVAAAKDRVAAADAKLRSALMLSIERCALSRLRKTGRAGRRVYATEQWLVVRLDDDGPQWMDAVVCESKVDGVHRLRVTLADGSQSERTITLHPWNHAPRELMSAAFESCRAGHARRMRAQHASIVDMLSGQRLDVLTQCVPIEVAVTVRGDVPAAPFLLRPFFVRPQFSK